MSTFDLVADLPLEVDGYALEGLRLEVSSGFERLTTVVRVHGGGHEGVGEDVVYDPGDQLAFQTAGAVHDLSGRWAFAEICDHVASLDLFPEPPSTEVSRRYRLWAFHSALLDLALHQGGRSLGDVIGRRPQPMRYVCSLRLGEPPTLEPIRRRLALDPGLRFKLDATSSWTPELIDELVQTGAVDSVDLKGFYRGSVVDQAADPILYRRVAVAFPDAWLEDPDMSSQAAAQALADAHERITWDAPIHSVADIVALEAQVPIPEAEQPPAGSPAPAATLPPPSPPGFAPRVVNIKPSRVGSIRDLFATYDHCAAVGIGAYGGGQTELGPGRGQAQYLAALFHADGPNDLAPSAYNEPDPPAGIPSSPLVPPPERPGFRWNTQDSEGHR